MESAGFHLQHQLQDESVQSTTSATPPDYKPSASQSWIPSNIYNGCTSRFLTECLPNSRELGPKYAMIDSLLRTSTGQCFGFHDGKSFTQQSASDLLLARIKDGGVSDDLPKLSEIMNSPSRAMDESRPLISISEPSQYSHSFFSSRRVTGKEFLPTENFYHVQKPKDGGMALTKRYNFGGVSSLSNLPTLDMTSSLISCSLGLNSQMVDLHRSYGGSCGRQLCYDTFGLNEESISPSHSDMQGCENSPSNSSNKISSFISEVARTKRPHNCSRQKEYEAKAKKSRPSCPPLKVRKEKLVDRIQTLQRLVAPFGKTNTASVLTETIGYIHFLHGQIQTLSIPYMKSSQSKPFRMVQLDSKEEEDRRDFKPNLRSRGLCLVPLSYASYIHRCA